MTVIWNVLFSQRVCGLIPEEEDHEETQQSGNDVCSRSSRNGRWRSIRGQLAQWLR
jgi:hypothetical protein